MSGIDLSVDLKTGKFQKNEVTVRALKEVYEIKNYFKKHGDVPEEYQYLKEGGWDYIFMAPECSDKEMFLAGIIRHLLCKRDLDRAKEQMGDAYNEEIEKEIMALYEPDLSKYPNLVFLDDDEEEEKEEEIE